MNDEPRVKDLQPTVRKRTSTYAVLMSMNINGQDTWYPEEPSKQWQSRAPFVREILEQHKPDIVCWQEFGLTSYDDVMSSLGHTLKTYMGEQNGETYVNPISWNTQLFTALDTLTFWLTEDGKHGRAWDGSPRGCSAVLLEHIDSGKQYWIYNVHLDNKSKLARLKGVELILNDVKIRTNGLPVIVAGDFNASSHSLPGKEQYFDPTPLRLIEDSGFIDVMQIDDAKQQAPLPTFHAYHGRKIHDNHDPFGVWDPDHIYIRGLQVARSSIIDAGSSELYPSDHYPIETSILL